MNKELWDRVVNGSPAMRTEICKREPQLFAMYYFSQYFTYKTPDFHYDFYQDCKDLTNGTLEEAMWCAYRDSAKTSIAKIALVLWWICYKKKQYINWDSYDKGNAESALFDITLALQTNKKLINDFGHLYYKKPAKDAIMEAKMKRINNFITENGVKVEAFSTQEPTRGRVFGHIRPDAFILDDFENSKTKESMPVTEKVKEHIDEMKSGLPAGASVLYLCNYLSDEGSVAYIMELIKKNPRGRVRFVPVVDAKGNISWPDKFVKTNAEAVAINKLIEDPKKHKISLEAKRASLTDPVYETEMMNNPAKAGDLFFDRDKVLRAMANARDPIEIIAGFKIWAKYNAKHRYGGGADTSEGIGGDANASAWIDFSTTPNLLVGSFEDNEIGPDVFGHELKRQGAVFAYPYLVPEINMTGYATISALIDVGYPQMYQREVKNKTTQKIQKEFGWKATMGTKFEVLGEFRDAFESGELEILDMGLLEEMKFFTKNALRLVNRQKGATRHYDKLRAAALAWHARKFAPLAQDDRKKLYQVPGQNEPYRP